MRPLGLLFIFTFLGLSQAFADIFIDQSVYHTVKPVTKIGDLGVTVATNEKDFHLVLKSKPKKKNPVTRSVASEGARASKRSDKKSKKTKKLAGVAAVH